MCTVLVLKTPKLIRKQFCKQFKSCNDFIKAYNPFDIIPGKIFP